MVDIMCKYGADIDAKNQVGNTPLHVAAQHGMVSIVSLHASSYDNDNFLPIKNFM